jgi:two-component system phosphate regulon sensor histidine kinase PhoR
MTFRTRSFLTALATAAVTLTVAMTMMSWSVRQSVGDRIERSLINEARLAAETLSHRRPATPAELDAEADAVGRLVAARVTFIAPDGTVVGDSELSAEQLQSAGNHKDRPEIQQARREGLGVERRYSATLDIDMLYVAVPIVQHEATPPMISEVRLALPLYEIRDQLTAIRRTALVAAAAALATALFLAWAASLLLSRRVRAIAATADRYAAGDFSKPARDYGHDEIGTVARVLDDSIREIGRRADELDMDRARMAAILAGMTEGVLVVNAQGHLQLANGAARRLLRLAPASEAPHYLEVVRNPDIAAQISEALRGREGQSVELTLPSGVIATVRSAPVRADQATGAVVVLHDITELRRADRVRRDFVANVSHELRTPLTAVRGYVEALQDGGADAASSQRFLEIISRHTLRMERLVRDLLRLARLDAGQEPRENVACSVNALFGAVEGDLQAAMDARNVRVERDIAADAQTVHGDPAGLHDLLRNLLENAINYSPEGGVVTMASHRRGESIVITVSDQGPGIPETDLSRVFERFYRVDKARSRGDRDPGGTGLGLAIVKHLVELHGGRVTAANGRGGGAVFTVEFGVRPGSDPLSGRRSGQ